MKKSVFFKLWGIVAFAAMVLFTACPPEAGPGPENDPELPAALKNTNWKHTGGDKVQFGDKNTVTVIPASGTQGNFTLKDSQTVSEANRTTLWFGSSQTADFIVYQNSAVYSVVLGNVNKTNGGWSLDSGSSSGNEMSWTAVTDNPLSIIFSIAYGNGKFVAVGGSGYKKMAYSSDGITWTAVTTPFDDGYSSPIVAIAYGNGMFVAGGTDTDGRMAYSSDGITWTATTAAGTGLTFIFNPNTIAWGNGTFVAGGNGFVTGTGGIIVNEPNMMYSSNGATWTAVTDSSLGYIRAIAYGNGKFVAGNSTGKMAYSSDGITWTAVTDSVFGTSEISSIAWGNGKFVACGGYYDNKMAYSSDGIVWTAVTDSVFGTSEISSIAWGNGKFVACGGYYDNKMAYSSDGITWTAVTDTTLGYFGAIVWGNGKFVAGDGNGRIAYSSGD